MKDYKLIAEKQKQLIELLNKQVGFICGDTAIEDSEKFGYLACDFSQKITALEHAISAIESEPDISAEEISSIVTTEIKKLTKQNSELINEIALSSSRHQENDKEQINCYACQGGGCPVCSGTGYLIQNVNVNFIDKALKVLWELKNDDEFYFMSYGRELLNNLNPDIEKQSEPTERKTAEEWLRSKFRDEILAGDIPYFAKMLTEFASQSLPEITDDEIIDMAHIAYPDFDGIPDSHTYSYCRGAEEYRNKIKSKL